MNISQITIRNDNFDVIEEIDYCKENVIKHTIYSENNDIVYYKTHNFEYPSFKTINSPQEQEFINIVKDGVIKIDEIRYPNFIFLFKNGKFLFEYNLECKEIWFTNELVSSFPQKNIQMGYEQTQYFLKDMTEKHFNCKDVIPVYVSKHYREMIEEHFNYKIYFPNDN